MKKLSILISACSLALLTSCASDTNEQNETVGQHVDTTINDVKTTTAETKEDMKEAGSDAKEGVKGAATDVKEGVKDAYDDTKNAVKKGANKVDEKAKEVKEDLKKDKP